MSADAAAIAACAVHCLLLELETWPKPGLVSHVDRGSHDDMDAATFRASAAALEPYLYALANAGARGGELGQLRSIGVEAEAEMLAATSGVNTHRGAIFGLGLLCAAAGASAAGRTDPASTLGAIVTQRWGSSIAAGPALPHSHGGDASRRYGAGGARMEAAAGFPTVYEVGLAALRRACAVAPDDAEAQRVEACFALISVAQDTNLLHRGGLTGLRFARHEARAFLDGGGVSNPHWRETARSVHERFLARRLSPGGSADLLAMTLFVAAHERP